MASSNRLDFQAELDAAYIEVNSLRAAYNRYIELSQRVVWLERHVQGFNVAKERYEMGQTSKGVKKADSEKGKQQHEANVLAARFRSLSPEKQKELEKLMEIAMERGK